MNSPTGSLAPAPLVQIAISQPFDPKLAPAVHRFRTESGEHALVVNGSQIYSLPDDAASLIDRTSPDLVESLLERFGIRSAPIVDTGPLRSPPLRALSLSVAQKCNLACSYCYAQEGAFGGKETAMGAEVAFSAVDMLFSNTGSGERVQLAFLGGEPLTHRDLIYRCTERASDHAKRQGVNVGFSITTNGTLITPEVGEFFEEYAFAVTISLDGVEAVNDRLRMFKDGRGSYQRILERVEPLLRRQRRMQVSARVTVTPDNLNLLETLTTFLAMGFHSVGFSPMLRSPKGNGEMSHGALESMLSAMIECGEQFERHVHAGERFGFSNLSTALHEIHKGTHRPYPCGAGAGYMGVSAEGDLYACHRFVEDPAGWMGDVLLGVREERQNEWLAARNVHRQEPCRSCWARYLCGGGCHHEVIQRGRPACDYIRGWLDYCLKAYIRMLEVRPEFFAMP